MDRRHYFRKRPGPLRRLELRKQGFDRHQIGSRIDVDERHIGAAVPCGVGCRDERVGHRPKVVAGAKIEGEACQMQRRRTIGHGDRMLGADALGKSPLERRNRRTRGQPIGLQYSHDRRRCRRRRCPGGHRGS